MAPPPRPLSKILPYQLIVPTGVSSHVADWRSRIGCCWRKDACSAYGNRRGYDDASVADAALCCIARPSPAGGISSSYFPGKLAFILFPVPFPILCSSYNVLLHGWEPLRNSRVTKLQV